jgi:hypothetical protein
MSPSTLLQKAASLMLLGQRVLSGDQPELGDRACENVLAELVEVAVARGEGAWRHRVGPAWAVEDVVVVDAERVVLGCELTDASVTVLDQRPDAREGPVRGQADCRPS